MIQEVSKQRLSVIKKRVNERLIAFYNATIQKCQCMHVPRRSQGQRVPWIRLSIEMPQSIVWLFHVPKRFNQNQIKDWITQSHIAKALKQVKLYAKIYSIKGLVCSDSDVNAITIWALAVDYQWTIINTSLKTKMRRRWLNLEMLTQESRKMHKMRSLGKGIWLDIKQRSEVALPINNERKCFKYGKARYVKKYCPKKDLKDNPNNNESAPIYQ